MLGRQQLGAAGDREHVKSDESDEPRCCSGCESGGVMEGGHDRESEQDGDRETVRERESLVKRGRARANEKEDETFGGARGAPLRSEELGIGWSCTGSKIREERQRERKVVRESLKKTCSGRTWGGGGVSRKRISGREKGGERRVRNRDAQRWGSAGRGGGGGVV